MSLANKLNGLREIWAFDNWLALAATRLLLPHKNILIYHYRGLKILTDHSAGDANGARAVLTSSMYSRFLKSMRLNEPVSILDIGANNGGFPLMFLANDIRLKKVVSVELNPYTCSRLLTNLEANLDCDFTVLNSALCGKNCTLEIPLGIGSVGDNIYADLQRDEFETHQIDGFALDHFCKLYFDNEVIDICKIDVEGAEFEVFSSPEHQRITQCRYLIMEIHGTDAERNKEIIQELERLGLLLQPTEIGADPAVHFFVNSHFDINNH